MALILVMIVVLETLLAIFILATSPNRTKLALFFGGLENLSVYSKPLEILVMYSASLPFGFLGVFDLISYVTGREIERRFAGGWDGVLGSGKDIKEGSSIASSSNISGSSKNEGGGSINGNGSGTFSVNHEGGKLAVFDVQNPKNLDEGKLSKFAGRKASRGFTTTPSF